MLAHWALIEADFQEVYAVDLASGVLRKRDAHWLQTRIAGLLNADTRLSRRLGLVLPLNNRYLPIGGVQ